jgi:hypothetical protein
MPEQNSYLLLPQNYVRVVGFIGLDNEAEEDIEYLWE